MFVPLKEKYLPSGGDHVVMAVGNAACKNALPTSAGLKIFMPNPPQISFPMPIATIPPRNAIHNGKPGGNVSPRSSPVINALPSFILSVLKNDLLNSCSVKKHPATEKNMTA